MNKPGFNGGNGCGVGGEGLDYSGGGPVLAVRGGGGVGDLMDEFLFVLLLTPIHHFH